MNRISTEELADVLSSNSQRSGHYRLRYVTRC